MLTFLVFISVIQGCSIILQGEARREESFSRLELKDKMMSATICDNRILKRTVL